MEVFIKWIGIFIMAFASVLLGVRKSMTFSARLHNLYQLKRNFILIKGEIEYQQEPLIPIFKRLSCKCSGEYKKLFLQLGTELEQKKGEEFSAIWRKIWNQYKEPLFLQGEDMELIVSFGTSFSGADRKLQMNTIQYFLIQLDGQIEDAREQKKVGQKLYQTLGVVGGFFLILVLI